MTAEEREQVKVLRGIGASYAQIASELEVSVNTVKAYCQRHGLGGVGKEKEREDKSDKNKCKRCGSTLIQRKGCKPRKFCSDVCRKAWWHIHRSELGTAQPIVCMSCQTVFLRPGPAKYCSSTCYFNHRFGRKVHDQANAGA